MLLSWKDIVRLLVSWLLFGAVSFLSATHYIGGAATLLMLVAFASWSIFPLLHIGSASVVAMKIRCDPSPALTVALVFVVFVLLVIALASGLFNFV